MDELSARVRDRVLTLLAPGADAVAPDRPLRDLGLTSLQQVALVTGLEDELGVQLPAEELTPENLGTVQALAAAFGRRLQPGRPPLEIATWAREAGRDGTRALLEVQTGPRPVPVLKTDAATGSPLLSSGALGADILHLPAGECFLPHTHPGDHLLVVLAGEGTITVDGRIHATGAGQAYLVQGSVVHAVGAITDHVILAVGAPHRPLDAPDRQSLTEYAAILGDPGTITCSLCDRTADDLRALAAQGCPHAPVRRG